MSAELHSWPLSCQQHRSSLRSQGRQLHSNSHGRGMLTWVRTAAGMVICVPVEVVTVLSRPLADEASTTCTVSPVTDRPSTSRQKDAWLLSGWRRVTPALPSSGSLAE